MLIVVLWFKDTCDDEGRIGLNIRLDVFADAKHGHSRSLDARWSTLEKRVSPSCIPPAMAKNFMAGSLFAIILINIINFNFVRKYEYHIFIKTNNAIQSFWSSKREQNDDIW